MATVGKPITCRAAVNWEPGHPASIENVEIAAPKAGEIRVKMSATGICFSDVSMGKGIFPELKFPTVLGHEGVGVVESLGQGVTTFQPGDTVIPLWSYQCGKCRWCTRGRRNICQQALYGTTGTLPDRTTRIRCKDQDVSQCMGIGLFSEYVTISALAAEKIKPSKTLEHLASYGCCMPTGYGAAVNAAKVDEGSVVAIWGLGAIGLCVALGCRDSKARRIIGVDINKDKFDIGKKFGCTEFLNPEDHEKPVSAVLKDMTKGVGVDFAFVCVGRMDVMEDAVEACAIGQSECIILGLGAKGAKFGVNHGDIIVGKSVRGSWCGDCNSADIPKLVEKYNSGDFPTDELVTQVLLLDQINEGFDLLKNGKAIRAVIKMDK